MNFRSTYTDLPSDVVDLAAAVHSTPQPGANREDVMQINLMADGDVSFNHHRVDSQDLRSGIQSGLALGAERRLYLWIDARATYKDVKLLLREARLAGIQNVSFTTR